MNKHQVKGSAKNTAGKMQQAAGRSVGSAKQEAKGMVKQAAGRAQKAYGDVKESARSSRSTSVKH